MEPHELVTGHTTSLGLERAGERWRRTECGPEIAQARSIDESAACFPAISIAIRGVARPSPRHKSLQRPSNKRWDTFLPPLTAALPRLSRQHEYAGTVSEHQSLLCVSPFPHGP